ncbi:MFS transporter [Streptosporangiaceae bacterium NEAU-GS5]|nr:MFS transporter [Streptosporangiaceae bacterium NEAU-GS5]
MGAGVEGEQIMRRGLAWRFPHLGLVYGATALSTTGWRALGVAYPLLALGLTKDPEAVGLVGFALTIPGLLLYIPAGVLVDRLRRRSVMLFAQYCRAVMLGLVVAAQCTNSASLGLVTFAAFIEGTMWIFYSLAESALIPTLVPPDRHIRAFAGSEVNANLASLAGRPLAGFLPILGSSTPFLFTIGLYVLSIFTGRRVSESAKPPEATTGFAKEMADGVRTLLKSRFLRNAMALTIVTNLTVNALIIVFVADSVGLSSIVVGAVLAVGGVGGAAGAAVAPSIAPLFETPYAALALQMWGWVFALLLALGGTPASFGMALFLTGVVGGLSNVVVRHWEVGLVDHHRLAKITSVSRLVTQCAVCMAAPFGGYLVAHFEQRATLVLFLVMLAVAFSGSMAAAVMYTWKRWISGLIYGVWQPILRTLRSIAKLPLLVEAVLSRAGRVILGAVGARRLAQAGGYLGQMDRQLRHDGAGGPHREIGRGLVIPGELADPGRAQQDQGVLGGLVQRVGNLTLGLGHQPAIVAGAQHQGKRMRGPRRRPLQAHTVEVLQRVRRPAEPDQDLSAGAQCFWIVPFSMQDIAQHGQGGFWMAVIPERPGKLRLDAAFIWHAGLRGAQFAHRGIEPALQQPDPPDAGQHLSDRGRNLQSLEHLGSGKIMIGGGLEVFLLEHHVAEEGFDLGAELLVAAAAIEGPTRVLGGEGKVSVDERLFGRMQEVARRDLVVIRIPLLPDVPDGLDEPVVRKLIPSHARELVRPQNMPLEQRADDRVLLSGRHDLTLARHLPGAALGDETADQPFTDFSDVIVEVNPGDLGEHALAEVRK